MRFGWRLGALALPVALGWQLGRWAADRRVEQQARRELLSRAGDRVAHRFDPASVDGLPEAARRFFLFAIEPGTPLRTVVDIRMAGRLSLGSREDPRFLPMQARQVLAPPHGLLWQVRAGQGALRLAGSDAMVGGHSWTRFWLWHSWPVVRAGDDADHLRSSFGRVVAEAAFWSPAFLLPGPSVSWSAVDADTARATVTHGSLTQEVEIRVDAQGQPLWVRMPRWSHANPDGVYRLQPFGGEVGDFRRVAGFQVPFRVDGGNFFGTPEYFPFYQARVLDFRVC
ncbi:hypothetical protein JI739_01425 [Ramlibacter sp. AW1]|uniref:Uncharacterized protein n=1 Tax=Ramlibacter aurantiacus TaxID=2801330 RepID=A0A936ZQ83_9BURK|nr:DUF6544 family protein [Ramlibacter aurantiacus]MBL0418995.1 hypothetical protein [Ramlibacter aurantiacus]